MSGSLIDDLGRALAQPISRRRTMCLFLAGGAALALPPLRPRIPLARGGNVLCFQREGCFTFDCHPEDQCCVGPDASPCQPPSACCPPKVGCCDACSFFSNTCVGGGNCGGGRTTGACERCCRKRGQGKCKDANRFDCCPAGQAPEPPRSCDTPELRCFEKLEARYRRDYGKCDAAQDRLLKRDPYAWWIDGGQSRLICEAIRDGQYQNRIDECLKVPDNNQCDGTCSPQTLTCNDPRECEGSQRVRREEAGDGDPEGGEGPTGLGRRRARVDSDALRRRLRVARPRMDRSFRELQRALSQTHRNPREHSRLHAAAYRSYRKNVLDLRRSIARGNGGRPQRLMLRTLDSSIEGLAAFRLAVLAEGGPAKSRLLNRGSRAMREAERTADSARRALGCGPSFC